MTEKQLNRAVWVFSVGIVLFLVSLVGIMLIDSMVFIFFMTSVLGGFIAAIAVVYGQRCDREE